jgi:hypothetical protein
MEEDKYISVIKKSNKTILNHTMLPLDHVLLAQHYSYCKDPPKHFLPSPCHVLQIQDLSMNPNSGSSVGLLLVGVMLSFTSEYQDITFDRLLNA